MSKAYQFAIVITVPADNYEEAKEKAGTVVDDMLDAGIGVSLETEYERDGSEENQRVLYLHDESKPLDLD